jgi:HPt (histidine-containing phosphotransfer) domain-containing protein
MRANRPAAARNPPENPLSCSQDTPAFDAAEFHELAEMIGDDGAAEMVMIFEAETRDRLRRLEAGDQDLATQQREMHTLKGAAGSVAAPWLATLGWTFEQAACQGIAPTRADVDRVAKALEEWLLAVQSWRMAT